jgi:hypothetical protein
MNETHITFSPSNLEHRTEEEAEQIKKVLEYIKPLQTKMLGEKTVWAISKGAIFESIQGGRHINYLDIISLLSDIASLTQISIIIILGLKSFSKSTEAIEVEKIEAVVREEAKNLIVEKISNHPELKNLSKLISEDSVILDRIMSKVTADLDNSARH